MTYNNILKLGFSPCPNDSFVFEAIVNKRIDIMGLNFKFYILDIEDLNKKSLSNELDISKLSFNLWKKIKDSYTLLDVGSALGNNCGPLLISKKPINKNNLVNYSIAIPGKNTTANMLLSYFYPQIINKTEMLFSDISTAVFNEEIDLGLIIHEERFTYKEKGLIKLLDLGELWEEKFKTPLPLGGIFAKKHLTTQTLDKVNTVIYNSIKFAQNNLKIVLPFIKKHSASLSEEVILKHIDLYVNDFTLSLGEEGKKAIKVFGNLL